MIHPAKGGREGPALRRLTAARAEGRLARLNGADAERARFDAALTVCAMRYISDLHIGRVNPPLHLGLDVN